MGLGSHGSCLHLALVSQFVVIRATLCEDTGVNLFISPLLSDSLVPGILTLELRVERGLLIRPEKKKRIVLSSNAQPYIFVHVDPTDNESSPNLFEIHLLHFTYIVEVLV